MAKKKKKARGKKAKKRAVKAVVRKTKTRGSKAKKAKAARKPAKRARPAKSKKAKAVKAKKAPVRKAKAKKRAARDVTGEGNYSASRRFRAAETEFVKRNRKKIPEMGKAAEAALEGPQGDSLRAAEDEARAHAAGQPQE